MLRLPSHRSILFKKLPPTQESPTMHFTDFSAQESYCSWHLKIGHALLNVPNGHRSSKRHQFDFIDPHLSLLPK